MNPHEKKIKSLENELELNKNLLRFLLDLLMKQSKLCLEMREYIIGPLKTPPVHDYAKVRKMTKRQVEKLLEEDRIWWEENDHNF